MPDFEQSYINGNNIKEEDNNHVMIKLDSPVPIRDEPRFPKEKWKTFMGELYYFLYCNSF